MLCSYLQYELQDRLGGGGAAARVHKHLRAAGYKQGLVPILATHQWTPGVRFLTQGNSSSRIEGHGCWLFPCTALKDICSHPFILCVAVSLILSSADASSLLGAFSTRAAGTRSHSATRALVRRNNDAAQLGLPQSAVKLVEVVGGACSHLMCK